MKTCVGCNIEKMADEFRYKQNACKQCEADPNVYFEKTCSKCKKTKDRKLFVNGRCNECAQGGTHKECSICNKVKPKTDFRRGQPKCIECTLHLLNNKDCLGCHTSKDKADFRRGQAICKECEKDPNVEYQKKCKECGEEKSSKDFRINRLKCLDCERSHGRNYRRTTTKAKEWATQNQDRMAELQRDWYQRNKTKVIAKEAERLRDDPVFKYVKTRRVLATNLYTGRIRRSAVIGTNRKQFLDWIKFRGQETMTPETYTVDWQLDHVIPVNFLYTEEDDWCFQIIEDEDAIDTLFSWYNICPLTNKENRDKGSKIEYATLHTHIQQVKKYIRQNKLVKDEKFFKYNRVIMRILDELSK